MVMCEGRLITPDDLGLEKRQGPRGAITLEQAREAVEKTTIQNALKRNPTNVSQAAKEPGISRVTLYRLMKKHEIGEETEKETPKKQA